MIEKRGDGGKGKEEKGLCAPTGTRTLNPLIKSQMLYQLSHRHKMGGFSFLFTQNWEATKGLLRYTYSHHGSVYLRQPNI